MKKVLSCLKIPLTGMPVNCFASCENIVPRSRPHQFFSPSPPMNWSLDPLNEGLENNEQELHFQAWLNLYIVFVTVKGKMDTDGYPFVIRSNAYKNPFKAFDKPFERFAYPFEIHQHPFEVLRHPFEQFLHPFVNQKCPFGELRHPFERIDARSVHPLERRKLHSSFLYSYSVQQSKRRDPTNRTD